MTLSTKGKIVIETEVYDNGNNLRNSIRTLNMLLAEANTELQFEMIQNGAYTPSYHLVRLVSLKDLFFPDILEDDEIKIIILNPAPKTPECKEFLEGTTLSGPKEQFVDYNLTAYKAVEIGYGKIHFKRKDDAIKA